MLARTIQLYRNAYHGLSREIWLLSLMMLINRSGTMVLPFLTLYLTSELEFSLTQAAWVMSSFGVGSILGSFLGGRLTDKIGAFQVMFWSLFLSLFGFISLIWVSSFYGVCAMILVASVIAESYRPASFAAIVVCCAPEDRTRGIALIRVAINLGMAIGPAIGGFIAVSLGFRYLFIIDGMTCCLAALFLKVIFSSYMKRKPARSKASESENENRTTPIDAALLPYQDRFYLFFLLLVFLNAFAFFQIFATEPVFLRNEFRFDERQIGLLFAFNCLLIVALEMPLIYMLEKYLSKVQIVIGGTFLIGWAYVLLVWLPAGWWAAIISMFFLSVGEMTSLPFLSTMALNRGNDQNRGRYMAMFTATYSISHIVAPNMGLQMAEHLGFNAMWHMIFGFSLFACLGFVLMQRMKWK
ncbi:MAG: MFS transporter [Bacteroidota bacterium]